MVELYELYDDVGLHYGPAFRTVESIQVGDDESVARVRLGADAARDATPWVLHPALLDGCLQSMRVLSLRRGLEELYLPVALEALEVEGPVPALLEVHARLREPDAEARSLTCDLELFDEHDTLRVRLRGVQLVRTSRAALVAHTDPLRAPT